MFLIRSLMTLFLKVWSAEVRQVVDRRFRKESIAELVSHTELIKNTLYTSVIKLPLLVGLLQKVVLSVTSCPTIIILENTSN
jgi:hypothetical protein